MRRPTAAPVQAPPAGRPPSASAAEGRVDAKVVIVGSGPAGLTAAIYAARANLEPIVLAGSAPGGQLMLTSDVENYPGFPDGIQGPELMAALRAQAERFGTADRRRRRRPRGLLRAAVPALGARHRVPRPGGHRRHRRLGAVAGPGLRDAPARPRRVRLRHVRRLLLPDREIAVVGGGDTAFEEATYLTRFATKVHLLHRRDTFRASKIMVDRALEPSQDRDPPQHRGRGGPRRRQGGGARAPRHGDRRRPRRCRSRACSSPSATEPNTEAFRDWLEVDEKGYLVVHDETGSKIDGVFIAGDVHDHRYRQAVTAAADGCKAAIDAERWLEAQGITEAATATAW